MKPADWREVLGIIQSNSQNKAAGLDGVNTDLVFLHAEDSKEGPSPFLEILTHLINVSLASGKTCHGERPLYQ